LEGVEEEAVSAAADALVVAGIAMTTTKIPILHHLVAAAAALVPLQILRRRRL
jgi:hypothetical protein